MFVFVLNETAHSPCTRQLLFAEDLLDAGDFTGSGAKVHQQHPIWLAEHRDPSLADAEANGSL